MTPSGNDRPAISELRSPRRVKGNRLIHIEPGAATPNDGDEKTEFDYHYMGWRVRKRVWTWDADGDPPAWMPDGLPP